MLQKMMRTPIYRKIRPTIRPIKQIILTDISLLQTNNSMCVVDKFHNIVLRYNPTYIELGNLPHTISEWSLYDYIQNYLKKTNNTTKLYVTSPNNNELYPHTSFWTSISSVYQYKKENITINEIKQMFTALKQNNIHKKLYVSCVNDCPFSGPIDIDYSLHELCCYYHYYTFDEICLCDTCGNLTYENFKYLVQSMIVFGVPKSKIGFQLRMNKDTEKIVRYGIINGFVRWDVVSESCGSTNGYLTNKQIEKWI
jgi:hypothetical protein